jgi:hypothetical protein
MYKTKTISAFATHLLNNNHEYEPITETMKLFKKCNIVTTMNCWEDLFIQHYKKENILIGEQQTTEPNPLFKVARISTD